MKQSTHLLGRVLCNCRPSIHSPTFYRPAFGHPGDVNLLLLNNPDFRLQCAMLYNPLKVRLQYRILTTVRTLWMPPLICNHRRSSCPAYLQDLVTPECQLVSLRRVLPRFPPSWTPFRLYCLQFRCHFRFPRSIIHSRIAQANADKVIAAIELPRKLPVRPHIWLPPS